MQNIINLFVKYGSHFLFAFLQVICFYIIVNYNQAQKSIFLNSSKIYNAKIVNRLDNVNSFLSLKEVNDSLALHNSELLEQYINQVNRGYVKDSLASKDLLSQFQIIPANVVNNTSHLRNNHFTIDKGAAAGVKSDMGVISKNGVVGVVRNTSKNFGHVVSILNSQLKISATVKGLSYPGTVTWEKANPRNVSLLSIPKHAKIAVGDTVITSGYSTIFPKGVTIGTIKNFSVNKGSSNYTVEVILSNEPSNISFVYVINNALASEQAELEEEVYE